MKATTAQQIVTDHTLGPTARYAEWQRASATAREFYVRTACHRCEQEELGKVDPLLVIAGISRYYDQPENRNVKLSIAFGMVFTALTKELPLP